MKHGCICLVVVFILFSATIFAIDEVKFESGQGSNDLRMKYKLEVLEEIMKHTIKDYGNYSITTNAPEMNSLRALSEIKKGETLNTYMAFTSNIWEEGTIPIRIPIRMGILNYRLLLVHKSKVKEFAKVKTANDLKKFTVGLRMDWTINKVMREIGFDIIDTVEYDSLFHMLDRGRFDFIPRGVNEIYKELESRKNDVCNLVIEPNLLIIIPSPTYIFVSPKEPKLAKRIEIGLEKIIADGTLNKIFDKYYRDFITKSNLKDRHIVDLGNPMLPEGVPFERTELWVDLLNY